MKTAGGSGYAQLTKQLISKHKIVDIPLVRATPNSLKRYGGLLKHKDETLSHFKNEVWPKYDGFRSISNGTGNEAAPAIGNFDHFWRKYNETDNDDFYICCAKNEAISRQYETAMYNDKDRYIYVREMNYHPVSNILLYLIFLIIEYKFCGFFESIFSVEINYYFQSMMITINYHLLHCWPEAKRMYIVITLILMI